MFCNRQVVSPNRGSLRRDNTNVAAALEAVKAGEWITITSKHRPAGDADQIVAIRPYVQAATQR